MMLHFSMASTKQNIFFSFALIELCTWKEEMSNTNKAALYVRGEFHEELGENLNQRVATLFELPTYDKYQLAMESSRIKIESGIQMLARLSKKPCIEKFYPVIFGSGPKQGDCIEVYSDGNTSFLLAELICEALIPQELYGPEAGVIIFKTDGIFCYSSVLNLLRNKIMKHINCNNNNSFKYGSINVDLLINSTLKNLHIIDLFDATQFYLTIQNLENLLTKYPNISLVVFHTLTAFYWSEQDFKIIKMDTYIKKLLSIIQKVVKDHKTTVLYSRPEYFSSSKEPINNLEPCCQQATEEQINYRIQIVFNNNGLNLINVRTFDSQFQKEFNLIHNEITWFDYSAI